MDRSAHQRSRGEHPDGRPSAASRASARWGLDRVLLLHGPAVEDETDPDLARALQRALRHLPVVMLHDRLLPVGTLLEHVAIGPGGVTVVAGAVDVTEPLQVERLHGMFGAHAELLRDGASADRTALVAPLREQVVTVRQLLDDFAPVVGALCLPSDGALEHLHALHVEGVLIAGPKAVAELVARDGDLRDYELAALVDLLDGLCPPALE
jgi:hypothetical protein